MSRSLLSIPPEILVHILAFLPVQSLLRFSQTCQFSHSIATSSLHTLNLGIHPTRVAGIISRLGSTQYPRPRDSRSAFALLNPSHSASHRQPRQHHEIDYAEDEGLLENPYKVSVLIPDAQEFNYQTLQSFHNALTKSVLIRHGGTLRNLELSLWTLTVPIAKALASLSAVRTLSIRIQDFPNVRAAVPRRWIAQQRVEEREAWDVLADNAAFAPRLEALRIEGGEMDTQQLSRLLRESRWCRELWLCSCNRVEEEVWSFLGTESGREGRAGLRLQILGIMHCGGVLGEEALNVIGTMKELQFLSLQGCHGMVHSDDIETRNQDEWKIPECIPPLPRIEPADGSTYIEVDPAYMD
ncbi:hypothetical protein BS50DRAFT_302265 [Corynespora cassiicola Philippines]|uniref:F-box domain-containing protein n=1 Tax=Corynespora cassiicola Philippines TaxID=1448308 RepID=A0A2T2NXJ1_CORCC|nr:hypothetical protein BS50DRAFT_302265 [Corynespora cassiicola Philippines]